MLQENSRHQLVPSAGGPAGVVGHPHHPVATLMAAMEGVGPGNIYDEYCYGKTMVAIVQSVGLSFLLSLSHN